MIKQKSKQKTSNQISLIKEMTVSITEMLSTVFFLKACFLSYSFFKVFTTKSSQWNLLKDPLRATEKSQIIPTKSTLGHCSSAVSISNRLPCILLFLKPSCLWFCKFTSEMQNHETKVTDTLQLIKNELKILFFYSFICLWSFFRDFI